MNDWLETHHIVFDAVQFAIACVSGWLGCMVWHGKLF